MTMRGRRILAIIACVLLSGAVAADRRVAASRPATAPAAAASLPAREFKPFQCDALGIALVYPADFEVGRFAARGPDDTFFRDAAVFVERSVLRSGPFESD